jgi:hypothetical protein
MCILARLRVRDFFIKRHLKRISLIEDKAMITVTNIHFVILNDLVRNRNSQKKSLN